MHRFGITHRDIKPENIVYSKTENTWKLCDFGASKRQLKSMTSVNKGTSFYMAPEIQSGKHDKSVDVFALGILFLELFLDRRIDRILKSDDL